MVWMEGPATHRFQWLKNGRYGGTGHPSADWRPIPLASTLLHRRLAAWSLRGTCRGEVVLEAGGESSPGGVEYGWVPDVFPGRRAGSAFILRKTPEGWSDDIVPDVFVSLESRGSPLVFEWSVRAQSPGEPAGGRLPGLPPAHIRRPTVARGLWAIPGYRDMEVRWEPPEDDAGGVSDYRARYRRDSSSDWVEGYGGEALTCTLDCLDPEHEYEVGVQARTTAWGSAFEEGRFSTSPKVDLPSRLGARPVLEPLAGKRLRVSWGEPGAGGGPPSAWHLALLKKGAWIEVGVVPGDVREFAVPAVFLDYGTRYSVSAAARNAEGMGAYYASAGAETEAKPPKTPIDPGSVVVSVPDAGSDPPAKADPPPVVVDDPPPPDPIPAPSRPTGLAATPEANLYHPGYMDVHLQWTASTGRVAFYAVGHRERGATLWHPTTGYPTPGLLLRLKIGKTYEWQVQAVGPDASSAWARTSVNLAPGVPSQPTGLEVAVRGPRVRVSWEAPLWDGGTGEDLVYHVHEVGGPQRRVVHRLYAEFPERRAYMRSVYVVAVNSVGQSPPSRTVSVPYA